MSRKRAKAEGDGMDPEMGMDDESRPSLGPPLVKPMVSYASMLRDGPSKFMDDAEDELSDADCCFVKGESGMTLKFSEKARSVMENSWRFAVVVNLMGKPSSVNSYDFILRGLRRKWRSHGGWKLIDLPNDYYAVKFELESDMNEALCGGPWILAGQTLVVRRWSAAFNPMTDRIGSMAVWVRVLGLPLLYFTDYAMCKVGKLLGEVVKVDQVTLSQERGRFGRVCVEVDLFSPFKSAVVVDGVSYKVQYEGLSLLCFSCGVYGHSKDKCPCYGPKDMDSSDVPGEVSDSVKEMPSGEAQDQNMEQMGNKVGVGKAMEEEGLGPWMLVNARGKKKSGKPGKTFPVQGSRFSSLQILDEETDNVDNEMLGVHGEIPCSGSIPKAADEPCSELVSRHKNGPKEGMVMPSVEVGKVWNCLQNRMKEKAVLGEPWVLDVNSGAYIQANGLDKGDPSPRVPLVDMSNASSQSKSSPSKVSRRSAGSGKPVISGRSRMPFPKNPVLSNTNFSGFFGRCPPEEVINKEVISDLVLSKDHCRRLDVEGSCSGMDADAIRPSSFAEEDLSAI